MIPYEIFLPLPLGIINARSCRSFDYFIDFFAALLLCIPSLKFIPPYIANRRDEHKLILYCVCFGIFFVGVMPVITAVFVLHNKGNRIFDGCPFRFKGNIPICSRRYFRYFLSTVVPTVKRIPLRGKIGQPNRIALDRIPRFIAVFCSLSVCIGNRINNRRINGINR